MTTPQACPRCRIALHVGSAGGATMFGCAACGGVFLGSDHARRLFDAPCDDTLRLARSAATAATVAPDTSLADLPCPVCASPMARRRLDAAAIELDSCGAHGTWFDRHELEAAARAFSVQRAYGRHNAAALGGAVAGGAAVATAAVVADPGLVDRTVRAVEQHGGTAMDVADVGLEVADVAIDAGLLEGAAELAGGAFELLGGILSGLGDLG